MAKKPKKPKKVIDPESLPYNVGKWKPDPRYQFPKGTSGNPSGKSKKPKRTEKTQEDYYSEVVSKTLPDGTVVEMTRREMAYDNNSRLAAKGDHKAFKILLEHDRRKEAGEAELDPLIFNPEVSEAVMQTHQADLKARLAADNWADSQNNTKPKGKKNG